jgi:hypothetical protein
MAEILGVVVSGISVVQIAGQLLGCVKQVQTFCRSIRNIPGDLQSTLNEVKNLGQLLSHIEGFNDAGSSLLKESLQICQAAASALEALTSRTMLPLSGDSKFRPKHLLKAVLKEEAKELKMRIDTAQLASISLDELFRVYFISYDGLKRH